MNRMFQWISRPFAGATTSLRRSLLTRFDDHVRELLAGTVNARMMPPIIEALGVCIHRLERVEDSLGRVDRVASNMAEEVDLVLNGLSREIFRLQAQVEILQRSVNEEAPTLGGLSIVDDSGEISERSKAG